MGRPDDFRENYCQFLFGIYKIGLRTDRGTGRSTDRPTDTPSDTDARTLLKSGDEMATAIKAPDNEAEPISKRNGIFSKRPVDIF